MQDLTCFSAFYINILRLLYSLRLQGGRGYSPLPISASVAMSSQVSKVNLHTVINTGCLHQIDCITLSILYQDNQDFKPLQCHIDNLVDWSRLWQYYMSKCNLLHLGQPHGYGEYLIDGTAILSNNVVKGLGIL